MLQESDQQEIAVTDAHAGSNPNLTESNVRRTTAAAATTTVTLNAFHINEFGSFGFNNTEARTSCW